MVKTCKCKKKKKKKVMFLWEENHFPLPSQSLEAHNLKLDVHLLLFQNLVIFPPYFPIPISHYNQNFQI
jgi:hypothetical protein